MASAVTAVFDTAELLETILVKLPIQDLLQSQRVSTYWKQVIEGSRKLQQGLFMMPIQVVNGPLTLKLNRDLAVECENQFKQRFDKFTLFRNPLTQPFARAMRENMCDNEFSFSDTFPPSWKHPSATWRKMLIMHPPVEATLVCYEIRKHKTTDYVIHKRTLTTFDTSKMRMGELAKLLDNECLSNGVPAKYVNIELTKHRKGDVARGWMTPTKIDELEESERLERMKTEFAGRKI